jgi:hypothetical protein
VARNTAKPSRALWDPLRVPAALKLTGRRERRLLDLVAAGATISEASRAVEVDRRTVHRHTRLDPAFALRLADARAYATLGTGTRGSVSRVVDDWEASAQVLDADFPEHWAAARS